MTKSPVLAAGWFLALLVAGVGAFAAIRWLGEGLTSEAAAMPTVSVGSNPAGHVDVVFHVLATLAAVIALGRMLSNALRWIGQPAVIGEVLAGIVLGPSVLGAISPDAMHFLIPSPATDPHGLVTAALKTISQLGVVLYMFLVGLELNTTRLERQLSSMVAISHCSILVPFVLGAALALWLYPTLSPGGIPFTSFALFLGVAMAITAFPVLARVLTDRSLEKSDLGVLALSCAAAGDVSAWCLLAVVVGVAQSQLSAALPVFFWSAVFIAGMFLVVRPIARKRAEWFDRNPHDDTARPRLFVAILLAALVTEAIGIHAVFGAFLLGVVIPNESRIATDLRQRMQPLVTILLLPAFFAITGMNTRIGLISGWESWLTCGAIIVVATAGKFGGTVIAAKMTGLDWTTSSALGVLMNTRGLMELIVLNIGLSLGVISPTLYAMMVLMALATTAATAPILQWLIPTAKAAEIRDIELDGVAET